MSLSVSTIIIRIVLTCLLLLLIDFYVFKAFKTIVAESTPFKRKTVIYTYWIINILLIAFICLVFLMVNPTKGGNRYFYWVAGSIILFFIPKLFVTFFLLLEDVGRLIRAIVIGSGKLLGAESMKDLAFFEGRKRFLSQLAIGIASIPFLAILHGITRGKYNYTIHRVTLKFKDLPEKFNGYTITQISDIHSGSFNDTKEVKRGVELINQQKSELILFTGDLVNNMASEMDSLIDVFKQLKASDGKYSILGNHDYGDYIPWPSIEAKQRNFETLKWVHHQIGFKLLLNESTQINKGSDSITLTGVENWGKPPFPQYGNLEKASTGVKNEQFKVLMSHDPSHFDAIVKNHPVYYHLTLSGHTHGFQFGVEIPGIKWSPVQYRYPKWAGLYEEAGRYLYVNRGFGFLGFPGRVGIWPEITVIKLEKDFS